MTNDRMADSSVQGTITWAHPGDPHGSPGPGHKLVQRQCARSQAHAAQWNVPDCALVSKAALTHSTTPISFTAGHLF